ncbi:MAG: ribonuclease Z [Spirochaetaceae bacterium]
MNMEAFVLGTGGMMPLPGRHLTSVLLRREGQLFLFDCGEGTQVSLRALNLRWKKITAIFISHTHADHVTGLPGMLMLSSQVDRDEPLYIIGPPRIREYVELSRNVLEMYINFDIVVWEIEETRRPQTVFRGEGFTVRSFPVFHTRDCIGYTLEEDRRPGVFHPERAMELGVPRGPLWSQLQQGEAVTLEEGRIVKPEEVMGQPRSGRKISYVTDSLRHRSIEREVRGSDLLICEGMFEQALEETSHEKRHMTAADAGRLARAAGGVKRLGLIHYSPRYTRKDLKRLEQDAREEFPEAFLTKDRQTIEIPYRD